MFLPLIRLCRTQRKKEREEPKFPAPTDLDNTFIIQPPIHSTWAQAGLACRSGNSDTYCATASRNECWLSWVTHWIYTSHCVAFPHCVADGMNATTSAPQRAFSQHVLLIEMGSAPGYPKHNCASALCVAARIRPAAVCSQLYPDVRSLRIMLPLRAADAMLSVGGRYDHRTHNCVFASRVPASVSV